MERHKNNLKIEVVVSKYQEDMTWLSELKGIDKITIYDKSDTPLQNSISLPNIGREAHTYLQHIINNYDNLCDYVIFLQGNPKDHLVYSLDCLQDLCMISDFQPMNNVFKCDLNGSPHHDNLELSKIIFDEYFIDKPESVYFTVGAQFSVSKKVILNRKIELYESLIKNFYRQDISNHHLNCNNKMPWVMERIWYYIFNSNYRTKYDFFENKIESSKYDLLHLTQPEEQRVIGPIQDDEALLLYSIVKTCRIHTIVEIGGLNGYSAKNFLKSFTSYKDRVYTIDINPVERINENHIIITKDCKLVDANDIKEKIGLIFFDAHMYEEQIIFFNNMVATGLIDDDTIISLHDTGLHPYQVTGSSYYIDGGWCHQPVERMMVNYFKDLGYDSISFHTSPYETSLPFRHGLTIMSKFKKLNV